MYKDKALKFSPSKAHLWMHCPGALWLTKDLEQKESAYAKDGTGAHALLEMCISKNIAPDTLIGEVLEVRGEEYTVTEDCAMAVQYAYDLIKSEAENCAGVVFSEKKLTILPGLTGTVDCAIVSCLGDTFYVLDYKHGAGVPVSAKENEQMLLYAYGAAKELKLVGVNNVRLTIIQPRCERRAEKHSTWETSWAEVEAFASRAEAQKNRIEGGDKTLCDGEWCRTGFCEARRQKVCPKLTARTKEGLQVVGISSVPDASKLDSSQLARVLDVQGAVEDFFKDCTERALKIADDGGHIPGYSLRAKESNRKWADEKAVAELFGDMAYEQRIKSPAQMEKVKGVDKAKVAELTTRETTGFKLVKTN